MSDIAIRIDGLLFCLAIMASGALLVLLMLAFAAHVRWGSSGQQRSRNAARACAMGIGACLLSFAALVFYMNSAAIPVTGPDWLDWLALPWGLILFAGVVWRARAAAP